MPVQPANGTCPCQDTLKVRPDKYDLNQSRVVPEVPTLVSEGRRVWVMQCTKQQTGSLVLWQKIGLTGGFSSPEGLYHIKKSHFGWVTAPETGLHQKEIQI